MNEDTLNMEIRQFLKKVGVTSQREIEHAIQNAMDSGRLTGSELLGVKMTLEIASLDLTYRIEGDIALE